MLGLVTHPAYDIPLPDGHSFPATKFSRLMAIMARDGLLDGFAQHHPEPVACADLAAVHCPDYINAVAAGTLSASGMPCGSNTRVSAPKCWRIRSASCTRRRLYDVSRHEP